MCRRETGEGEKQSARGTMGRKNSGTAFPPSHRPPRALLFLLEYAAGASAVERDKVRKKQNSQGHVLFRVCIDQDRFETI